MVDGLDVDSADASDWDGQHGGGLVPSECRSRGPWRPADRWLHGVENRFEAVAPQTLSDRSSSPTGPCAMGRSAPALPLTCVHCRHQRQQARLRPRSAEGRGMTSRGVPAAKACRRITLRSTVTEAPIQDRCVEFCPTYRRATSSRLQVEHDVATEVLRAAVRTGTDARPKCSCLLCRVRTSLTGSTTSGCDSAGPRRTSPGKGSRFRSSRCLTSTRRW